MRPAHRRHRLRGPSAALPLGRGRGGQPPRRAGRTSIEAQPDEPQPDLDELLGTAQADELTALALLEEALTGWQQATQGVVEAIRHYRLRAAHRQRVERAE